MLPQMALTPSLAIVAFLMCFSFSVNPQHDHIYPSAIAPASWTNSPSLRHNFTYDGGEIVRSLLLRLNATHGMSFATGFYCSFLPCKSFFLSIFAIDYFYGLHNPPQVIWSANRARPVSENATLQLTSQDGLTLRDSDGSLVWSTSRLNQSVAGINITTAGNLVLFDINNSTIWQSFDHPTDCPDVFSSSTNSSNDGNSLVGKWLTLRELFSYKNQPDVYSSEELQAVNTSGQVVNTTPSQPSSSKVGQGALLFTLSIIGFAVLLLLLALISICIACLRRREEVEEEDIIEQLPGMTTRFTFEELRTATENFIKILGKGGFGTVFEGRWGDERITVKRLDNVGHGKKDFLAEVQTIGSIHHINLVRMIGFCADNLNKLLVYEYMCNGSLDQWIYCKEGRVPLDWPIRFKIISDIAKGLCYLHEDCRQKIVHFDIKPGNILLDEKFNAKVSDFGLSKLIDRDISRVMTKMRGTPGYLAPEWLTAVVTEKVDVYSFGVVVMEILSGRRNIDDSQTEENRHLIKLLEEKSKTNGLSDLIDKNLGEVELYKKEIVDVMELAMWCLQWDSTRRPSMLMVVKVLEGGMEVETSILDYNFVSSIPMIVNIPGVVDHQSASLQTSVLSGPR